MEAAHVGQRAPDAGSLSAVGLWDAAFQGGGASANQSITQAGLWDAAFGGGCREEVDVDPLCADLPGSAPTQQLKVIPLTLLPPSTAAGTPDPIARASNHSATAEVGGHMPCSISPHSTDGFGHQLVGTLSCQALAATEPRRYSFTPAFHTGLEHSPTAPELLLEFLNDVSRAASPEALPLVVPHLTLKEFHHAAAHRCEDCEPLCDSCWAAVRGRVPPPVQKGLRERVVLALKRHLPSFQCAAEAPICIHVRQKAGWEKVS
uniref:Uncharacterized protein n=1 Tax=Haptolina brevifila TaxID=156173 RepID=A0A7S2G9V6_9EUKA